MEYKLRDDAHPKNKPIILDIEEKTWGVDCRIKNGNDIAKDLIICLEIFNNHLNILVYKDEEDENCKVVFHKTIV